MFGRDIIRRQRELLGVYEERLKRKTDLINECESIRRDAENRLDVVQECNEALAVENRRLAGMKEYSDDLASQLYAEWCNADRLADRARDLDRENERLWQENVLLRAALLRLDPAQAREICAGR